MSGVGELYLKALKDTGMGRLDVEDDKTSEALYKGELDVQKGAFLTFTAKAHEAIWGSQHFDHKASLYDAQEAWENICISVSQTEGEGVPRRLLEGHILDLAAFWCREKTDEGHRGFLCIVFDRIFREKADGSFVWRDDRNMYTVEPTLEEDEEPVQVVKPFVQTKRWVHSGLSAVGILQKEIPRMGPSLSPVSSPAKKKPKPKRKLKPSNIAAGRDVIAGWGKNT